MKNLITLTISLFFISNVLFATTINIPTDNSTIQAGTYSESIDLSGKNILVKGNDTFITILGFGDGVVNAQ